MKNRVCNFEIFNGDCISEMKGMETGSVDFTLTDIPYDAVNRKSTNLTRFDFCPYCGKKIDWKEIRENG